MSSIFGSNSEDDRALLDLVSQSLQQPKVELDGKPVPPANADTNHTAQLAALVHNVQNPESSIELPVDQQSYVNGLEGDKEVDS